MKQNMYKSRILPLLKSMVTILLISFLVNCEEEVRPLPVRSTDLQIAEYIAENTDQFSEFDAMIRESQIRGLLNSRGPLTLFLPTDEAINEYYQDKGISSFQDLDSLELSNLVLNHVVPTMVDANSMVLGALPSVNALGDYLVTEFEGIDIVLNKKSKIIDRDISNLNGITHVVDKVIEPVDLSVYELLKENGGYSIFTEALEITGIKDTLNKISIPFGTKMIRTRYTILAVHDTLFKNRGINDIDDLKSKYSPGENDFTDNENGLYRYVEYHCLLNTYFLADFEDTNYPALSRDTYVAFEVKDDYKINPENDSVFTTMFLDYANTPAKNGVIHPINDLLPVIVPEPVTITWEVTEHFDIMATDWFETRYARFTDGQNTFQNIKWEGDFLLYYWKPGLEMSPGWQMNGFFWIEITTPKIPKGKYLLSAGILQAAESPILVAYVDGERCEDLIMARDDQWKYDYFPIKEVEWKETKEHKVLLRTLNSGLMFWRHLRFEPIVE